MAQDWIDDLVEFGAAAAAQACGEWRRTQTRKPLPADIRKLCIEAEAVEQEREQLHALPSLAARDEYARSVGWKSEAERVDAIRRDEADRAARYERARLVREEAIRDGGMRRGDVHRAAAAALRANGVTVRESTPDEPPISAAGAG